MVRRMTPPPQAPKYFQQFTIATGASRGETHNGNAKRQSSISSHPAFNAGSDYNFANLTPSKWFEQFGDTKYQSDSEWISCLYRGVRWLPNTKVWRAEIHIYPSSQLHDGGHGGGGIPDKESVLLEVGVFNSASLAAAFYDRALRAMRTDSLTCSGDPKPGRVTLKPDTRERSSTVIILRSSITGKQV